MSSDYDSTTSVRKNVYSISKNESDTEKTAHRGEISYTYKNPLLEMEKTTGATYKCPNWKQDQFTDCMELNKVVKVQ